MQVETTRPGDEAISSDAPLPYAFKNHWLMKLAAVGALAMCVLSLFHMRELSQLWAHSGWLFRAFMLFAAWAFSVGALQALTQRVIFKPEGIESRNTLGITTSRRYAEIERVVLKAGYLELTFRDGARIKLWSGMGDLKKAAHILRTQMGISKNTP